MNMHKNTRLTPHHRQAIWTAYTQEKESVTSLARRYQVSRVTIYRALKAARGRLLKPQTSTNNRFKQTKYGMKRLAKVERGIQEKLKKQAKRYNKSYPGEMVHVDTKRLPLLKGQKTTDKRDYLFVAIDDFSRELYGHPAGQNRRQCGQVPNGTSHRTLPLFDRVRVFGQRQRI